MTEAEKKIFDMQPISTQKAMGRTDSQRIEYYLSPIPKSAQCLDEDGNVFVNQRTMNYHEVKIETHLRYERGAYLSILRDEPVTLHMDSQKKENAVNAFMDKLSVDKIKERFKSFMSTIKEEVPVLGFKWKRDKQN